MSIEVLTTIVSVATLLVAMAGGFGWMIHRIDAVDAKLTDKIDAVEAKLTDKIEAVEAKLTGKIEEVGNEVTEVKIAVARLEGPPRRLLPVR